MNKGKPQIITSSVSENYGENRNKGSTIKTHKHLYEKIISLENIQLAITKASRGKLKRASVQRVLKDRELYAKKVQDKLMGKDLKLLESTTKKTRLENGKARELAISPFYPNQIIHHALANIIEPLLLKTLSTQTCACIKGRGVDYGLKRVKRYAKVYRYYLKCDIAKFYAHINLAILQKQIARNISCARTLTLIAKVLGANQKGLDLGSYLSALFGNVYLRDIDRAHTKGVKLVRYADDIVLFSDSKRDLWRSFGNIKRALQDLGLQAHKVCLRPMRSGLDFLGVVSFESFARVRKATAKRIKDLARLKRVGAKEFARIFSYYGYVKRASCFNLFSKILRVIKHKIKAYCKKAHIAYPLKGLCFYRREPRLLA
ncbi:Retron-type reverse transcriptase [Helicobacter canis]|uniref:Retron-type reverse transcriptase n=1 Tax=Helicobacter canis TaxID=29419 RepID=A0A377J340_9HELI|nr:Retron-type reverse transcriptase [Helicobacter canis]STP06465.1 Retron-type reverse transcriptase [Helicobacter canis]